VLRLSSLHPLPMNRAFGISLRDTGQGEVELDFRERCIQFLLFHLFRVFMADDLWDKPLARCESEVVVIVRISDGAQVEGTIAARELTIGGRFKGTIQADRVMLTSSAVVEGEIHHRSLAIEENAWFAGASRPKEASASEDTDPPSPIQFVPPDGNRQINGLLEVHAERGID
jgi:hypothetical protein